MDGIHHVALRVADCEASARFYSTATGLVEMRRFEEDGRVRAVWMRAGQTVVMLERSLRGAGKADGSGHVLVFPTDDLKVSEQHLQTLGVRVTDRTAATIYFEDPDGHRAGLSIYRFEKGAV